MKGESNPVFVTSALRGNKFMSRLQIILLEIIKAERPSSVTGFCVFDGVYWKKMQVDNQVRLTCKGKGQGGGRVWEKNVLWGIWQNGNGTREPVEDQKQSSEMWERIKGSPRHSVRMAETRRGWGWGDVQWPRGVFYGQSKCPSDKTNRKGTKYKNVGQLTLKVSLKHFNREESGVQEWLSLYMRCLKAAGDYSILNTLHWVFDFQDIQGDTVKCREKFLI